MSVLGHGNGRVARCVVWSPPGEGTPAALSRVLEKRGLGLVPTDSPCRALAELCLAERGGDRVALIVTGDLEAGRMRQAVERFAPKAVVWVFQPCANPPLRPIVVERKTRATTTVAEVRAAILADRAENGVARRPGAEVAAKPAGKPAMQIGRDVPEDRPAPELKLAPGIDAPGAEPPRATPTKKVSARDVLDDAELEMLLAGERGTGDHGR